VVDKEDKLGFSPRTFHCCNKIKSSSRSKVKNILQITEYYKK